MDPDRLVTGRADVIRYHPEFGGSLSGIIDKKGDSDRLQYPIDQVIPEHLEHTLTSDTSENEGIMARLEAAADAGDETGFLVAVKSVPWAERTASEFLCATRLALKAGAHLAAREISALGLERHPTNPEMQKFARALAPPRVMHNPSPGPGHRG